MNDVVVVHEQKMKSIFVDEIVVDVVGDLIGFENKIFLHFLPIEKVCEGKKKKINGIMSFFSIMKSEKWRIAND